MPNINLENPAFISVDGAGRPNSGGTVEVYVADGLFTTKATIYSDQVKTSQLTNPVTLDDAGVKEIWYDVKVDIREKTKAGAVAGAVIRDTLNLDPNAGDAVVQSFNLAENGSFEIDADSDGQPDSWTIGPYVGSSIAITESIVTDGVKALEFNTTGAGGGGGTATSTKFPVTEGSTVSVAFSFYATNVTTLNTFSINWYDHLNALQSTSVVTMPASGSVPTSWTNYQEEITVDAAGTQGEVVLTGISSGGANLSSKAYFDGIRVTAVEVDVVKLTKTQTLTNKTLTSPTINGKSGRGIHFLANPEELLAISVIGDIGTSGVFTSSSGFSSTTLPDASAVAAIIRAYCRLSWATDTDVFGYLRLRQAGETGIAGTQVSAQRGSLSASATNQIYYEGEATVPLDGSSDFEYSFTFDSSATLAELGGIYLIGYYV